MKCLTNYIFVSIIELDLFYNPYKMANFNTSYQDLQEELKHWLNDSSLIQKDASEKLYASLMTWVDALTPDETQKMKDLNENYKAGSVNNFILSLDYLKKGWKNLKYSDIKKELEDFIKANPTKKFIERVKTLQKIIEDKLSDWEKAGLKLYIKSRENYKKLDGEFTKNKIATKKVEKAENISATKWTTNMDRYIAKKILNVSKEEWRSDEKKNMRIIAYATRIGTGDSVVGTSLKRNISPINWIKWKKPEVINERIKNTLTKINAKKEWAKVEEQMAMQVVVRELLKAKKWYEENKLGMVSNETLEKTYEDIDRKLAA